MQDVVVQHEEDGDEKGEEDGDFSGHGVSLAPDLRFA